MLRCWLLLGLLLYLAVAPAVRQIQKPAMLQMGVIGWTLEIGRDWNLDSRRLSQSLIGILE